MPSHKPILCLDFDGVIHGYQSGWQGADIIPDPPVPGSIEFIAKAVDHFTVSIFSSRSNQKMGVEAMQFWLRIQFYKTMEAADADPILALIQWPKEKPPAMVGIDDRVLTFSGDWSEYRCTELLAFQPWNKRQPADATVTIPRADLDAAIEALEPFHNAVIGITEFAPDFPMHGAALRASFDWYDMVQGGNLKRNSVRRSDLEALATLFANLKGHRDAS